MIKPDVNMAGLKPEILLAIQEAREVYRKFGAELVITSLGDGKHKAGSKHYHGFAVDLRIRHVDRRLWKIIAEGIEKAIGEHYDVVLEPTHIHVEYDPK